MPLYPRPHEGSLIPFLGGLISKAVPVVSRLLGGLLPQAGRVAPQVTRALAPIGRAIVPVARGLARGPAGRAVALGGGFAAGQAIVERGFKITIDRRTGQQKMVRRRRLNPTNIRAARRAVRRLRAFKRATRKVNRLLGAGRARYFRRPTRGRRGDILPFEHDGAINEYAAEDWADYADEMADLGYDVGEFFPEGEAAEATGD